MIKIPDQVKIGYWVKKLGFTCQDCYDYMLEEFLVCPLHVKLLKLEGQYVMYNYVDVPKSKHRKPILITRLTDFVSNFDKSRILRERTLRELKTEEEKAYEEFLEKKKKIEIKIQKCLNRRHYLAVEEGEYYFRDQDLRIADCRFCKNYFAEYDFCTVNCELKNRRGICPLYKFTY